MFSTVFEALDQWCHARADSDALTFLGEDGETEVSRLTYAEFVQRARLIGAALLERGAEGQRVVVAYPSGAEYMAAFFGCLYANAIAVPAYPPKVTRPDARFDAILEDSEAAIVLTTSSVIRLLDTKGKDGIYKKDGLQWLDTESLDLTPYAPCPVPAVEESTVAFLQYTSGSTSRPKGVQVTHGNIMRHLEIVTEILDVREKSVFIGWLPLFHDMGLIGVVLTALLNGRHVVLMDPVTFVKRPLRWLKAIERYKANLTSAPNFAYELCARMIKPQDRDALDLSSLRLAVSGAEPVRPETLRLFIDTFAPSGLAETTLCPSYGMAEATLIICGNSFRDAYTTLPVDKHELLNGRVLPPASPEREQVLVGCGRPLPAVTLRIVDPLTGVACPPHTVGEIWVSGPQVAGGYWNNPAASAETFQATLPDEPGKTFLRTGDLGFLHDGEIYVTGRHKDLIIIRGQNHYPQDLEWTVEQAHPFLSTDCSAGFAVQVNGEEQLVVVTEVDRAYRKNDLTEAATAIQAALYERHELRPHALVICSPGSVPKTTSGKIQRKACKQAYEDGTLAALHVVIKNKRVLDWGAQAEPSSGKGSEENAGV